MAAKRASTPDDWAKARLMFEAGKSLAAISIETGLNKGSISKKASAKKWVKGLLQPLIQDTARVTRETATLTQPQQDMVATESNRLIHYKDKRDIAANLLFDKITESIPKCEVVEIKSLADALDRVCITSEIAPRFNTAAVINNTNAQQTVVEPIRFTRAL